MRTLFAIGPWLMELFNSPLRESLTLTQKMGRVALITVTLVTLCVIGALGLTLAFFIYESGGKAFAHVPYLANALEILAWSIAVNLASIFVLLQVKRFDQRLMASKDGEIEIPPSV